MGWVVWAGQFVFAGAGSSETALGGSFQVPSQRREEMVSTIPLFLFGVAAALGGAKNPDVEPGMPGAGRFSDVLVPAANLATLFPVGRKSHLDAVVHILKCAPSIVAPRPALDAKPFGVFEVIGCFLQSPGSVVERGGGGAGLD